MYRSYHIVKTIGLCLLLLSITGQNAYSFDYGRFNFDAPGVKSVEVPFYTFNNQIIISVMVNDKVPLNFVLDTGSSQAILFDKQLGKSLGLDFDRKIEFSGAGNSNKVLAHRTTGARLAMNGISGDRMGLVVLNQDYLDMRRYDIHGVIGYQLFVRFAVSIDYGRRVLTIMEPDQYDASDFHAFEISIEQSKPYLNTNIMLLNNRLVPSKLMIDTGAAYGLSLITGMHPAIKPPKEARKVRLANGLGGAIHGHHGITQLKLSPTLAPEVVTFYIRPEEYTRKGHFAHNKMGSIGGEFLNKYVVIIDYINAKAFLKPLSPAYLSQQAGD